jgi:hypothetical protein
MRQLVDDSGRRRRGSVDSGLTGDLANLLMRHDDAGARCTDCDRHATTHVWISSLVQRTSQFRQSRAALGSSEVSRRHRDSGQLICA